MPLPPPSHSFSSSTSLGPDLNLAPCPAKIKVLRHGVRPAADPFRAEADLALLGDDAEAQVEDADGAAAADAGGGEAEVCVDGYVVVEGGAGGGFDFLRYLLEIYLTLVYDGTRKRGQKTSCPCSIFAHLENPLTCVAAVADQ
jgi:hypothetical protein